VSILYEVYKQTGLKHLVAVGYTAAGVINSINNIQHTVNDANKKAHNIIVNAEETANQVIRRTTRVAIMLIFLVFLLGLVYRWLG